MARTRHPRLLRGDANAVTVSMRARYRRPEVTARSGFAKRECGQVAARANLSQYRCDCLSSIWTRCGYRCGAEDVHDIDHRDRSVAFGERRSHLAKRAWT